MLTLVEVASDLKVTRQTLYNWIVRGKFPAIKIDGIWRVDEKDYEQFKTQAKRS